MKKDTEIKIVKIYITDQEEESTYWKSNKKLTYKADGVFRYIKNICNMYKPIFYSDILEYSGGYETPVLEGLNELKDNNYLYQTTIEKIITEDGGETLSIKKVFWFICDHDNTKKKQFQKAAYEVEWGKKWIVL